MLKHLTWLVKFADPRSLPIIPVLAKNIEFLSGPSHFYNNLLDGIAKSSSRIILSALYLGTGHDESQLVQAISDKLTESSAFEATILLDYHRAQRVNGDGQSSTSLLKPLVPFANFNLSLIKLGNGLTPLDKFQKWNEIHSIYHSKFGLFDRDVLITGANLSEIYFKKRQDRYMVIKDSEIISNYIFDLTKLLSNDIDSIATSLQNQNRRYSNLFRDQDLHNDTYIIPLLQHKKSRLTDIDDFLRFLSDTPEDVEIHLSTGYFNPGKTIDSIRFESLLAPSDKANGFYGGRGLLSIVPKLYTSIYRSYLERHDGSRLYLYERSDWSFHAKGIWIKFPEGIHMHIIGSSNFNLRSSERDLEFQLVLLTTNKNLINMLEEERQYLWRDSRRSCIEDFPRIITHKALLPLVRSFL